MIFLLENLIKIFSTGFVFYGLVPRFYISVYCSLFIYRLSCCYKSVEHFTRFKVWHWHQERNFIQIKERQDLDTLTKWHTKTQQDIVAHLWLESEWKCDENTEEQQQWTTWVLAWLGSESGLALLLKCSFRFSVRPCTTQSLIRFLIFFPRSLYVKGEYSFIFSSRTFPCIGQNVNTIWLRVSTVFYSP